MTFSGVGRCFRMGGWKLAVGDHYFARNEEKFFLDQFFNSLNLVVCMLFNVGAHVVEGGLGGCRMPASV